MIKEVHFLLTYTCNFECDHCFLYCGPDLERKSQWVNTLSLPLKILPAKTMFPSRKFPLLYLFSKSD